MKGIMKLKQLQVAWSGERYHRRHFTIAAHVRLFQLLLLLPLLLLRGYNKRQ